MSRMVVLILIAAVVLAIIALIVGVFSPGKAAGPDGHVAPNGVQKVAYGVFVALLFGVASGVLGEG